jgi:hypothetical protein
MRWVNLTRLPEDRKRDAWVYLRREEPDLARWLATVGKQLVERFDAEVWIGFERTETTEGGGDLAPGG